jgi:hypothetical protein
VGTLGDLRVVQIALTCVWRIVDSGEISNSPQTGYPLSESAVFKAYHKATNQQPAINAEVFRKEDTARCEEMYLKLQTGISKGDPHHIDTAVRVLAHKARLNGYAIEPKQSSGLSTFSIQLHLGEEKK